MVTGRASSRTLQLKQTNSAVFLAPARTSSLPPREMTVTVRRKEGWWPTNLSVIAQFKTVKYLRPCIHWTNHRPLHQHHHHLHPKLLHHHQCQLNLSLILLPLHQCNPRHMGSQNHHQHLVSPFHHHHLVLGVLGNHPNHLQSPLTSQTEAWSDADRERH